MSPDGSGESREMVRYGQEQVERGPDGETRTPPETGPDSVLAPGVGAAASRPGDRTLPPG